MLGVMNKNSMDIQRTEKELRKETEYFFATFINRDNAEYAEWSEQWYFNGEVPNNEKSGGCYALFVGDELVYIGKGIGKNSGLASKVSKRWVSNKGDLEQHYKPSSEFPDITSIMTIGFTKHDFIAAALEIYLIETLLPPRNKNYKPNIKSSL